MKKISLISILIISFFSLHTYSQNEDRIKEIRELYKEYNKNKLNDFDVFDIELHTGGSLPWMKVFTQGDKLIIKKGYGDEFTSETSDYYFEKGTIAFIYKKNDQLLSHWSEDTVWFKKTELRFYFKDGEIIKTLKKELKSYESKKNSIDFNKIKNVPIDYRDDHSINFILMKQEIENLLDLHKNLKKAFE